MEHLIARFDIPDPDVPGVMDEDGGHVDYAVRDHLKKFRREYCKPVQIRVLNVLRHWMNQHWYDFANNDDLRKKLEAFLESIKGKTMQKYLVSIRNIKIRRVREKDGFE